MITLYPPLVKGGVYFADDFSGVDPTGTADSKTGLQAAIDAIATAGGGTLMLSAGKTYRVKPLATGNGLFLRTGVRLAGKGTLLFESSTASVLQFVGIAPYGHDTTSTAYGAHELDIEDVTLSVDSTTSTFTASLLAVNHCPRARIRRVKFTGAYYHATEVNRSRDVQYLQCEFSGNYQSSQMQFDTGSGSGNISGSGAAGSVLLVENILVSGCYFGPRTDSTLSHVGSGMTSIELVHSGAIRLVGVRIENNTFWSAVETSAIVSTERACIGGLTAAYAEISGLIITGNSFKSDYGTGNAVGLYLTHVGEKLRDIVFDRNTFEGGWRCMAHICAYSTSSSVASPATTASSYPLVSGIRVTNNVGSFRMAAIGATTGGRVMRIISVGGCGDAVVSGNVAVLTTTVDASWSGGGYSETFHSHFIFINHVRSLICENNRFVVENTTQTAFQFYGLAIATSGFEASSIAHHQVVTGNHLSAAAASSILQYGYTYPSGVLRSAWAAVPLGRGRWENNTSSNVNGSKGATFFYPIGGGTAGVFTYGLPDWRPGYERIGEKIKSTSAPGAGWRALAGTAFASLNGEEQIAWQYQLGQGATALPTETNIYVRLSGSEANPAALVSSPP